MFLCRSSILDTSLGYCTDQLSYIRQSKIMGSPRSVKLGKKMQGTNKDYEFPNPRPQSA